MYLYFALKSVTILKRIYAKSDRFPSHKILQIGEIDNRTFQ